MENMRDVMICSVILYLQYLVELESYSYPLCHALTIMAPASGSAFSFLASAGGWQRWFFIALALVFSVYVVWELARLSDRERNLGWVYGLILGGAVGNVIDRIMYGHVVDFVLLHYQQHIFPAFNVADSALFCGIVLWGILLFQQFRQDRADQRP